MTSNIFPCRTKIINTENTIIIEDTNTVWIFKVLDEVDLSGRDR